MIWDVVNEWDYLDKPREYWNVMDIVVARRQGEPRLFRPVRAPETHLKRLDAAGINYRKPTEVDLPTRGSLWAVPEILGGGVAAFDAPDGQDCVPYL